MGENPREHKWELVKGGNKGQKLNLSLPIFSQAFTTHFLYFSLSVNEERLCSSTFTSIDVARHVSM